MLQEFNQNVINFDLFAKAVRRQMNSFARRTRIYRKSLSRSSTKVNVLSRLHSN